MKDTKQTFLERCYKDKEGNAVFYQVPNAPIIGWFVFTIFEKLIANDDLKEISSLLAFGCLFTWGFLELFSGVNYLRRFLGALILFVAVLNRVST